ncbi:YlcI/YnfO family protein [Rahnella sp. ChDrAdgB13]|uniref:YlcI/YnfO family protein n=1 Tax=Rahnella sp. ChDrAdgB13 TaxID=1850581 RepID=UPI001FCB0CD8|nr:YlcI/YnfO family protein [Rahnella sp. ChDrAdgB13]
MSTTNINSKSQKLHARVPHKVVEDIELFKKRDESTSQFIIAALAAEIDRRRQVKNAAKGKTELL